MVGLLWPLVPCPDAKERSRVGKNVLRNSIIGCHFLDEPTATLYKPLTYNRDYVLDLDFHQTLTVDTSDVVWARPIATGKKYRKHRREVKLEIIHKTDIK